MSFFRIRLRERLKIQALESILLIGGLMMYTHLLLAIFCKSSSTVLNSVLPSINPALPLTNQISPSRLKDVLNKIEIKGNLLPRVKPFQCIRCTLDPKGDLNVQRWLDSEITPRLPSRNLTISNPIHLLNISDKQDSYLMCIKSLKVDAVISGYILHEGFFERDLVKLAMNMLAQYPNATFLDVGANIGMFSVTAAALNHRVVAVDPFKTNLAFIRLSTVLQGTEDNVRFVPHTISNERFTLYPYTPQKDNEGGTVFLSEEDSKTKPRNLIGEGVDSITFNELLEVVNTDTVVVKMDIEGSECKALIPFLNTETKTKFIPYILMEWVWITSNQFGLCPDIQKLIQGFQVNGYFPVNATSLKRLGLETEKYWREVVWVHQDAKQLSL